MEGDDALVHSMENLIVDKKPTEYEDPAIVRFAIRTDPIHGQNLFLAYKRPHSSRNLQDSTHQHQNQIEFLKIFGEHLHLRHLLLQFNHLLALEVRLRILG